MTHAGRTPKSADFLNEIIAKDDGARLAEIGTELGNELLDDQGVAVAGCDDERSCELIWLLFVLGLGQVGQGLFSLRGRQLGQQRVHQHVFALASGLKHN